MDIDSSPEERKPNSFVRASASSIRRKRTVFNKEQLSVLINYFGRNPYPGIEEREELSGKITVDESRIQVWFQNRRARRLAQEKKLVSLTSTISKNQMQPGNSSPSQTPKEALLKHELSKQEVLLSSATRSCSWSGPGEPSKESDPKRSFSTERSVASIAEAACSGYDFSQSYHFVSSQALRPSTELQLSALPRPESQGSSSQCASFWALQGTQEPENYGTQNFYGVVKSLWHCQQQGWTTEEKSSPYHPLTFQCTQEPPCQLQQPPVLLSQAAQPPTFQGQLTASLRQSPQDHQSQTQPPPLMKEEEQPNELFPSFNQQEELQPINLCKRTAGLGSTMLLPDRHLPAHPGDLDTTLRDLDDILRDLPFSQGHLTAEIPDAIYKQINDFLAVLND